MNRAYINIWNESVGAWMAVPEVASSKGRSRSNGRGSVVTELPRSAANASGAISRRAGGGFSALSAIGASLALIWSMPVAASTITPNGGAACGGVGGTGTGPDGVTTYTNRALVDGSGFYSLVAGCSADGGNHLGVTLYGAFTTVTGDGGAAFGFGATAAQWSTAIGLQANAAGQSSFAAGFNANAAGTAGIAVGSSASAGGPGAIAIGSAYSGAAITSASGQNAVAIGIASVAGSGHATAIGSDTNAAGLNSLAAGNVAKAFNSGATAIGSSAVAGVSGGTVTNDTAVGAGATATGGNAYAGGNAATASAASTVAIGDTAKADSAGAVAIGQTAKATGGKAVSIGVGNTATGNGAVAIGDPNVATGVGAVAMGADNTANGQGAVTLGNTNVATGQGSVALGNTSQANSAGSIALGDTAVVQAAASKGVALGSGATVDDANSVALGAGSTTAAPHTGTTALYGGTAAGIASAANGIVSVGAAGRERQLQNVAAGTISATSTDAINGSQLNTVVTGVNNLGASTAATLGGGATYSPATGSITGYSQPINGVSSTGAVGGATAQTTVAGALSALNANIDNTANIAVKYDTPGGNRITLGATGGAGAPAGGVTISNLAAGVNPTDAVNVSQLTSSTTAAANRWITGNPTTYTAPTATGSNSTAVGSGAVANGAGDVALGSGTTSNGADATTGYTTANAVVNGQTFAVNQTPTNGAVAVGQRQITQVADGEVSATSTDAVNGSQLYNVGHALSGQVTSLGNSVASSLGGGSTYNTTTGAVTTNLSYGGSSYNSVQSLVDALSGGTTTAGIKYFHANSTAPDSQALGTNSVAVGPNAVANGANDVALGAGSATAVAVPTAGATIGGTTYSFAGANPASVVSVGAAGAERQIQNVAAGRLSATSTDAVNGSQLYATNQQVNANSTAISNINNGGGIKYFHANSTLPDSSATGADSVAIGGSAQATAANSVALGANSTTTANLGAAAFNPGTGPLAGATAVGEVSVGSAGAQRRITNVAAGAAPTDAVNVSQLQAVSTQLGKVQTDALLWDPTANGGTGAFSANHGGSGPNTITNVANGALSQTSTDAVNGSQLYATNQNVTNIANTVNGIENGAGIKYFHANSTAADSQATGQDSIAVGPLAIAGGASSLAAGNGASAQMDNGVALGAQANVSIGGGVAIGAGSVSDRAVLSGVGSIANGTHAIPYNTSDRTLLGAVSFGSAANNTYRQLTNVADGTQAQDAVTVRQLAGALSSFAVTGSMYFHANSTQPDSLAVGAESIAVGPTTVVNGDNGVGIGNGAVVASTAPGGVAIGEKANSAQADAIALGSGAAAGGAQSLAQGANAIAANAGSIAIGSGARGSATDAVALGAGATASFANSVALGAGSLTTVGAQSNYIAYGLSSPQSSAGEVNVGNRQITGVAPGRAGTDAVNVSQLSAVATQLTAMIDQQNSNGGDFLSSPTGTKVPPGTTGVNSSAGGSGATASGAASTAVGNNTQATGNGSTALGAGATSTGAGSTAIGAGSSDGGRAGVVAVGSSNTTRQVINVAAGTASTDAVNVQQLNAGVSNAISQANSYTDNQIQGLRGDLDKYRRDADGGAATAMAVAGLPQPSGPGRSMVSIAGSIYRGQSGQALGISTISENDHWIYKAAIATNTRGTYGAVIGAGYQW